MPKLLPRHPMSSSKMSVYLPLTVLCALHREYFLPALREVSRERGEPEGK